MGMKGKRWRKKKGSLLAISKQPQIQISKQKEKQTRKKNKKIGRRWGKDGLNRGRPGLMRGNKPLLVAIHTHEKPEIGDPAPFIYSHTANIRTHPPDGAFMQSTEKPPGFMRSEGQVPSGAG